MQKRASIKRVLLRGAFALLLFCSTFSTMLGHAGAQSSEPGLVSDTEYESPQFDFSLEWDDPWAVSENTVASQNGVLDQISIESPGAFLQIIIIFPTDEPQAYLDVLLQTTAESGSDYEEIGTDSGSDYLSATVDFTVTSQGTDIQLRKYIEVGTIESVDGDEALFTGSLLTPVDDFEAGWADLNDTVVRDGRDTVFRGSPEGISGKSSSNSTNPDKTPTPDDNNNSGSLDAGITGNTYVGGNYAFSVEWDDSLWEAEDTGSGKTDSVTLTSDDGLLVIESYAETGSDVKTCVTDYADEVKSGKGVDGFGRATGYTLPEKGDQSFGRLYDYTYTSQGKETSVVQYLECRPLGDDAFLRLSFLTTEDAYDTSIADYEDVVSTIEYDVDVSTGDNGGLQTKIGRQTDEDTKTTPTATTAKDPVLTSSSYTGGAYDYEIAFDKRVWTAEELTPAEGYEGVKLTSDGASVWFEAFDGYAGDPDTCVTDTADQLNTVENVSDVQEARRLDLPETDRDAVAAVYSYTYTQNNQSVDFVEYIECRELVKGSAVLRATIITAFDNYDAQIADIADLLGGVEIGSGSSNTSSNTNSNTTDNNNSSSNDELPGVKGRKYTSPQFDFTLAWDSSWEVAASTTSANGTTLTLYNGISTVLVFGGAFPADPVDCVDTLASVAADADGVSGFAIVTNNDGEPQSGSTDTFAYSIYSFTRGGTDYFDYIHCQPAPSGDFVVAIIYEMPVSNVATELTALQDLLNGLTVE